MSEICTTMDIETLPFTPWINKKLVKQTITRKGSFDSAHRVMNEKMKCFNLHGHTYLYELTFSFDSMNQIGYQIDFKEIKRVACQFIDDFLDHATIVNPHDHVVISTCKELKSKHWLMSLNGLNQYCNPTVENIAKELFLIMEILFERYDDLNIDSIKLYETPNCYTECQIWSILPIQRDNFRLYNLEGIELYRDQLGILNYDDRI